VTDVTTGRHRGREFWSGRFHHKVRRRDLGFDSSTCTWIGPCRRCRCCRRRWLRSRRRACCRSTWRSTGFLGATACTTVAEDHAQAVLHPRAAEALAQVPPFGFSCEGRRFVAILPAYRDPTTALAQLDAACDLLDLMPEQLWREGEQWAATHSP
jgi:hypothetical protein